MRIVRSRFLLVSIAIISILITAHTVHSAEDVAGGLLVGDIWWGEVIPGDKLLPAEMAFQAIQKQLDAVNYILNQWGETSLSSDTRSSLANIYEALKQDQDEIISNPRSPLVNQYLTDFGYPPHGEELRLIQARIILPQSLNEFSSTLQQVQAATIGKKDPRIDELAKNIQKENEKILALSPMAQIEEGSFEIAHFADAHREQLLSLPLDTDSPLLQKAASQAIDIVILAGFDKRVKDTGKQGTVTPLGVDRGPMVDGHKPPPIQKKVLVVLMDQWLKQDAVFSKVQLDTSNNKLWDYTYKMLDDVESAYEEMSYGRQGWTFDVCEVDNNNVPPRGQLSNGNLHYNYSSDEKIIWVAYDFCKKADPTIQDLKKYDVIIVFPGAVYDPNIYPNHGGLSMMGSIFLGSLVGDGLIDPSFNGITVTADLATADADYPFGHTWGTNTVTHELGHSLGLSHAHSYDCRYVTYGSDDYCLPGFVEYGDMYDYMGGHDSDNLQKIFFPEWASVRPHFNCVKKYDIQWGKAPVNVGAGTYDIAALEFYPTKTTQCLTVDVDPKYVLNADHPCDLLSLEYRTPRTVKGEQGTFGGLAVYCISSLAKADPGDIASGLKGHFTSLLDCTPDTFTHPLDGAIPSGGTCGTNLGYKISFTATDERIGQVTIALAPPCEDSDGDGYADPNNPEGCQIDPKKPDPDCDDKDSSVHPGGDDSTCNGKDDDCNGEVDGTDMPKELCVQCYDDDDHGDKPLIFGTTKEIKDHMLIGSWSDSCSGNILTENYCAKDGFEERRQSKQYDCTKSGPTWICKNGACFDNVCPDKDHDGYQAKVGNCILTSPAEDCNDNDPDINPGIKTEATPKYYCDGKDNNCDGKITDGDKVSGEFCPKCVDTDKNNNYLDGKNPYMQGTIRTTYYDGQLHSSSATDFCFPPDPQFGNFDMTEYRCENRVGGGTVGVSSSYSCVSEGKICQKGACVVPPMVKPDHCYYCIPQAKWGTVGLCQQNGVGCCADTKKAACCNDIDCSNSACGKQMGCAPLGGGGGGGGGGGINACQGVVCPANSHIDPFGNLCCFCNVEKDNDGTPIYTWGHWVAPNGFYGGVPPCDVKMCLNYCKLGYEPIPTNDQWGFKCCEVGRNGGGQCFYPLCDDDFGPF